MKPQFRASNGVYFTKQLFYEYSAPNERYLSLYSLKDEDFTTSIKDEDGNPEIRTFPSLRRLFLEEGDITGYKVASKYFAGWPHWTRLLKSAWFVDFITLYQEELQMKLASEQLSSLIQKANDPKIAQYLLNNGYLKKESNVGRPTKEKILKEAERISVDHQDINDDLFRIESLLA